jgi:hypothetical protein
MLKQIVIGVLIASVIAIVGVGLVIRTVSPAAITNNAATANGQANGSQFRGGGGGGQGQGMGQGAAASNVQMTTVQGNVVSVDQYAMTVQTSTGEKILVQGRPWTFSLEQKFTTKVGDQLKLSGFYQNGQFEVASMQNLANNATVQVRDQAGRPSWAGRGGGNETGYNTTTN